MNKFSLMFLLMLTMTAAPCLVLAQSDDEKQSRNKKTEDTVELPPGLNIKAEIGLLGYDSNVYRTNNSSYVDYFQDPAGTITVTPNVKSGFYVPVKTNIEYSMPMAAAISGIVGAKAKGNYYTTSSLNNANEYSLDYYFALLKESAQSEIELSIFGAYDDNNYYDRDSGDAKTTSAAEDISEKYKYSSYGYNAAYVTNKDLLDYNIGLQYESRDYVDTVVVSDYDHTILDIDAEIKVKPKKGLSITGGYQYSINEFSDRHARQITGKLVLSNPLLTYVYHTYSTRIRYRQNRNWIFTGKYKHQKRIDDGFVNYNDYSYNEFSGNIVYKIKKVRLKASGAIQARDYPNALAYDKTVGGSKTYSYMKVGFKADYKLKKWLSLNAEIKGRNVDTNDLRYDYERFRLVSGIEISL